MATWRGEFARGDGFIEGTVAPSLSAQQVLGAQIHLGKRSVASLSESLASRAVGRGQSWLRTALPTLVVLALVHW